MTPLQAQIVAARAYEAAWRELWQLMPSGAAMEAMCSVSVEAHRRAAEIMEAQQPKPGEADGWIIGNGDRTAWRTWHDGFSGWTEKPEDATRYARRIDAETVHAEDEDAWCVITLSEVIRANGGEG